MIKNVLDVSTKPECECGGLVHTCMSLCELTGICKDAFEAWDFIHITAFLVYKTWPLVLQTLTVKINSMDTLREKATKGEGTRSKMARGPR